MKRLSITARIVLISSIPLLSFLSLGSLNVVQQNNERQLMNEMQQSIHLFGATSSLIGHLQRERGRTAMFHAGGASAADVLALRNKTDESLQLWQHNLLGIRPAGFTPQKEATDLPQTLQTLRKGNEQANPKGRDAVIRDYSSLIRTLFGLLTDIYGGKSTQSFGKELSSVLLLENARESAGLLRANVSSLLARNSPLDQSELMLIVNLKSGIDVSLASPALTLTGEIRERLGSFQKSVDWAEVNRIFQQVLFHANRGDFGISGDAFWKPVTRQVDDLGELVQMSLSSLESRLQVQASEVKRWVFQIILLIAAALCCTVLITVKTSLYIIRGLRRAVASMRDIAEGEGDLTRRLEVVGQDEIGEIAQSFNVFVEKIQSIIRDIGGNAGALASSSTELSAIAGQMASGTRNMSEKAFTVAAAAEESSANTASVAAGMAQTTSSLSSVTSATEELTATIVEIASSSEKARAVSGQATQQAQSISTMMNELGYAAREIGHVTETITKISAQTNLLALNATIEAARAGEVGKGFAVVANEIKQLAQKTATATEDIKARIGRIQASSDCAIGDIEKIVEVIKHVGEIVTTIAVAIEEQSKVTREVADNIAQASMGVRDSNERVAQTAMVSQSIAQDIALVNATIAEIGDGGEQIQISSSELSRLAERLKALVERFRI